MLRKGASWIPLAAWSMPLGEKQRLQPAPLGTDITRRALIEHNSGVSACLVFTPVIGAPDHASPALQQQPMGALSAFRIVTGTSCPVIFDVATWSTSQYNTLQSSYIISPSVQLLKLPAPNILIPSLTTSHWFSQCVVRHPSTRRFRVSQVTLGTVPAKSSLSPGNAECHSRHLDESRSGVSSLPSSQSVAVQDSMYEDAQRQVPLVTGAFVLRSCLQHPSGLKEWLLHQFRITSSPPSP